MTLVGLLLILTLMLSSLIMLRLLEIDGLVAAVLALAALSSGQVVLLCEVLSVFGWLHRIGLLLGQIILLAGFTLIWIRKGRPDLLELLRGFPRAWLGLEGRLLLLPFLLFTLILLGVMISRGRIVAPDAMTYHLPRIHYWLNQGSALHFPTDDYRQVEFPPNASFLFLWMILSTGDYGLSFLAQFIAGAVSSIGIVGLARLAGFSKFSSMLAGLTFLTAPMVMLQLLTAQIDLITNMFLLSFVFFSMRHFHSVDQGVGWFKADLVVAGISFGLLLGTKLTAFFMLPGLALYIFILSQRDHQVSMMRRLLIFSGTCLGGFLIFGAFNYGLNVIDFNNPVASSGAIRYEYDDHFSEYEPKELQSIRAPVSNILRYAYQMMDWQLLPDSKPTDLVFQANSRAYRVWASLVKLDLEAAPGFHFDEFGLRLLTQNRAGFGVIGYMALLLSPLIFLFYSVVALRNARSPALTRAGYLFLGLSWFVAFSILIPWTEVKTRYFTLPMALIFVVTVPIAFHRSRWRFLFSAAFLIVLSLQALRVSAAANRLQTQRNLINERHFRVMQSGFSKDAVFGVSGRVWIPLLLEQFPDYTFQVLQADFNLESLDDYQLDGIIYRQPGSGQRQASIPFGPGQELMVRNQGRFLRVNAPSFGLEYSGVDTCGQLILTDGQLLTRVNEEERQFEFVLPTSPAGDCPGEAIIMVEMAGGFGAETVAEVACQGFAITSVESHQDKLVIHGKFEPPSQGPTFSCYLRMSEGWEGVINRGVLRVEVVP